MDPEDGPEHRDIPGRWLGASESAVVHYLGVEMRPTHATERNGQVAIPVPEIGGCLRRIDIRPWLGKFGLGKRDQVRAEAVRKPC